VPLREKEREFTENGGFPSCVPRELLKEFIQVNVYTCAAVMFVSLCQC